MCQKDFCITSVINSEKEKQYMKTRFLGNTGVRVSELGFGDDVSAERGILDEYRSGRTERS